MRAVQSTTVQPTPSATASAPVSLSVPVDRGPATDWPPLLAIIAFVIVSSVVLGWIGWKKRHA